MDRGYMEGEFTGELLGIVGKSADKRESENF